MPRPEITKLIADNLGALPHPDGNPRCLVEYRHFLQDEKSKLHFQKQAKDIGDCVQHLLERNGFEIRHRDDPRAADEEGYKIAKVKCGRCGKQILAITVDDQMQATMSGLALRSIKQLNPECPHE